MRNSSFPPISAPIRGASASVASFGSTCIERRGQAQTTSWEPSCTLKTSRWVTLVKKLPATAPKNLTRNLAFFEGLMAEPDFDADRLWAGLTHLSVIAAQVQQDDPAQLIFESLNSKGMPLATSDLIRNLLLIGIGLDEQERLYGQYWAPIEAIFADDLDSSQFTAALRGWLAIKAPELCKRNTDDVYATFKAYLESEHAGSLEELLFGLKGFCETFVTRSQSSGARMADAHNSYGVARVEGIISEKKLFGD